MKRTRNIEYPESLANLLRLGGKKLEYEIKTSSLVKLYELGKVSSGVAAKVLGLSRVDFLDLLSEYNISVLDVHDFDELDEDIRNH